MSKDAIYRQDAIDLIESESRKWGDEYGIPDVLCDLADLQPAQQWIPCRERLPELGERVLCQCRANIYEVLKLTVDGWYYDQNHCYMESFVIAWMPLPEPYIERRTDG